jgi:fibronectin-binding autotransporter adhesin
MRKLRNLLDAVALPALFAAALSLALAPVVLAQITINHSFTSGTVIDPDQMNTNFNTVGTNALNRTGGTITGAISVDNNITVDGADISDFINSSTNDLTVPDDASITDAMTVGGTLGVTGATTLGSTLGVTGAATLNSTLAVTGASTLTGKVTAPNSVISLRAIDYTLPAADGAASNAVLTTNGSGTLSWTLAESNLTDKTLTRTKLTNYRETADTGTAGATMTLNLATANHFTVTLSSSITTIAFTNVPTSGNAVAVTVLYVGNGSASTLGTAVTTNGGAATLKWPAGTAPTITTTSGKVDVVTYYTVDGGSVWYAFLGGQNF